MPDTTISPFQKAKLKIPTRQQNNHVYKGVGPATAKKTNIYKVTLVVN